MQGIFRALVWPLRAAQPNQKIFNCVLLILKYTPEVLLENNNCLHLGQWPYTSIGIRNIALKWVQAVRVKSARISADNQILVPARSTAYTAYTCEPEQQQVDHFIAVLQER